MRVKLRLKMSKGNKIIITALLTLFAFNAGSQSLPDFELTEDWLAKIENMVPMESRIDIKKKKNVLIFSLHTGYEHWCIPHTQAVMKLLGEKSGAYKVSLTKDIYAFDKKSLKK